MLRLGAALAQWRPADGASNEPVALLEAGWEEIVGADVARNSRPARIAGGTLTVTTRSSAWSHQLTFLSEDVLRAVQARVPAAGIEQLRFRVGRIRDPQAASPRRRPAQRTSAQAYQGDSATAAEALGRFRRRVERRRSGREAAGWKACAGCGALVATASQARCAACEAARADRITAATARLLAEAPWLGYAGTAALVSGLAREEYERVRSLMLAHWWTMLVRARQAKRLSSDGRERLAASSYVLLRSNLSPEEIMPATIRSILGDELNDLLYGDAGEGGVR
jgi:hypothetical protein